MDELGDLVRTYGLQEVLFVDDVFVGPGQRGRDRVSCLAKEMSGRRLDVALSISERADNITEDVFRPLRDMGVRQVLVGIESGDQQTLSRFNKRVTPEQNRHAIQILADLEIDPTVSFINFTPNTTLDQLRRNIEFLLELRVNFLQGMLNRFQIYAGTPLGDDLLRAGRAIGKFPDYRYVSEDRRVDVAHRICRDALGLFLTAAFEIKKVERALRLALFRAEVQNENISELRQARVRFRKLVSTMMEEAAVIFGSVIDFVEKHEDAADQEISSFTVSLAREVEIQCAAWARYLGLFGDGVPQAAMPASSTATTHCTGGGLRS